MSVASKRIVIVTGIPGVGKTTVLNKAADIARQEYTVEIVNYGSVMFDAAVNSGFVENRDQMRLLPPEKQREIQKNAAEIIAKKAAQGKLLIVDTHMLIATPEGYLAGLPEWVITTLKPDVIVLVEAEPEFIFSRRSKDETRTRDQDSTIEINTHQNLCRAAATAISVLTGATVKIVKNKEGMVDETAEELAVVLKGVN
ncbi:adenylate kinase [Candidatus Borrarchaeum sp.]|uniref:adenylate kinase n=1 Tax=Candidatus Borrarchaeum sp. TaxID=2846742 RepID=UPI00257B8ABC|nr:adenylate kinase [Candidatus Borrarchaeum sp.]